MKRLDQHRCVQIMKITILPLIFIICVVGCQTANTSDTIDSKTKKYQDFNKDWTFVLDTSSSYTFQNYNQLSSEKQLNLPHDWCVDAPFDSIVGVGKATGFLPGKGIGWYKKEFTQTPSEDSTAYLVFDGVYNNANFWLNDKPLGFHPYGYSPFYYDITSALKDNTNKVTVKVDHTRYADSRWYTGAGIYRNVDKVVAYNLHVPIWGVFASTPEVSAEKATVRIETTVKNNFDTAQGTLLTASLQDKDGKVIQETTEKISVNPKDSLLTIQNIRVDNPKLWSVEEPNLYTLVTTLTQDGQVRDRQQTMIGIRSIRFETDTGFYLNGKNMKIKGVCLHHDGGLVGAAVPKGVWRRRLQLLRDGGCNAIRIAHNPASNELLDLCDEMGFLVQDEFFDEWDNPKDKRHNQNERQVDYITRGYGEHFQEWAEQDLKTTIYSHRNHPSVFQWSIGNEIEWTYPRNADATGFFNNMDWKGNYFWSEPPFSTEKIKEQLATLPKAKYDIGKTAQKLAAWTREIDTTRPIIANCILPSASHLSGYAEALDIVGYSYRRVLYDYGHENYPDKPIMGTENLGQYHEWKAIMERPFIAGTFIWTGIDYMGEIGEPWPTRVNASGMVDAAGFPKGSWHMMKTLWNPEPHIKIATQQIEKSLYEIKNNEIVAKKPDGWKTALWRWQPVNEHWNYSPGEIVAVEVYSNCPEVELFLNGESLGKKKLTDFEDHIYKWGVPYAAGELKAVGTSDGKSCSEDVVYAHNEPTQMQVTIDKNELSADGYDVSHIVVQLQDANGHPVRIKERKLTFTPEGNIKILGVDNGAPDNVQTYQSNTLMTHRGRALLIVQSTAIAGDAKIEVSGPGLSSQTIELTIKN